MEPANAWSPKFDDFPAQAPGVRGQCSLVRPGIMGSPGSVVVLCCDG